MTSDSYHMPGDENGTERRPYGKRKPNGHGAPRALDTIWADEIEISLDAGGAIDGLLPSTGLTVAYGESGSGKTFGTIDMACSIAAGIPWRGMDVEQGVVIYIAAEGPESVKRRIWAWKQRHGVEHLPVLVVQSTVDLLNGDTDALVALVASVARDTGRVAMVVVDTLARAMTGNENAPEDMGRFVTACGRIREVVETHVLIVHHSGKDTAKGARGHSSLRAATDVELEYTAGCIKVTKNRDETAGRRFGFKLETVELGVNAKGRMVTTCVAVETEAPAEKAGQAKKARPLGSVEAVVFDCVTAALNDHGKPAEEFGTVARDIPRRATVVPRRHVDDAADRYLPGYKGNKRREAVDRALTSLAGRHLLKFADDLVWLPPPSHGVA